MNNIIVYVLITLIFVVVFCIIGSTLHKKVEVMSKEYLKINKIKDVKLGNLDTHTKAVLVAAISGYFAK